MHKRLRLSLAFAFLSIPALLTSFAAAQQATDSPAPEIVSTCEVEPDGNIGNCPPAVDAYFLDAELTDEQFATDIASIAAALAQRAQQAEADRDLPLCIDLSRGIQRTAALSVDLEQQQAIDQLATLMCCVQVVGVTDGIYYGTTSPVEVAGTRIDGIVAQSGLTFTSPSAGFDAVLPGDILEIQSGSAQGYYVISSVSSSDTLELQPDVSIQFIGFPVSEDEVAFEVRRREGEFTENSCTPGFGTAAIPVEEAPLASPQ